MGLIAEERRDAVLIWTLDREARLDAGDRGGSALGAYVLGLAFAFGWTPCIGPQLGAILSLAAQEMVALLRQEVQSSGTVGR